MHAVVKIAHVKFCARGRGIFVGGGGREARGIVSLVGGEWLASRPGLSAARGINPSVSLRADLDVSGKSFLLKPRNEPWPIV
jgi:hypothetical protein